MRDPHGALDVALVVAEKQRVAGDRPPSRRDDRQHRSDE